LVPPYAPQPGFWFGGGSLARDPQGVIWLSGRYRNYGDSRTGLAAGQRGLECAIFRSDDGGASFHKVCSWSKEELSMPGRRVLSIEGTALRQQADGSWELFVSSEKELPYPDPLASYQKPGTGVWTIDRLAGPTPDRLDPATLAPVLENFHRPEYLHVKDPVAFECPSGDTGMIFCSHPFSWSSSNSGLAIRPAHADQFTVLAWEMAARGAAWDVAATRITAAWPIPAVGVFADQPACTVYFYDGAECLRSHEESQRAHHRPRGYSCEEIGGAFYGWDDEFPEVERLSPLHALFVSPWGTGCSRYVKVLTTENGVLATWQQSQPDGSQPLVGHLLPLGEVERILGA
jgi:hypothetical protein